jgi:hypothetical protein
MITSAAILLRFLCWLNEAWAVLRPLSFRSAKDSRVSASLVVSRQRRPRKEGKRRRARLRCFFGSFNKGARGRQRTAWH